MITNVGTMRISAFKVKNSTFFCHCAIIKKNTDSVVFAFIKAIYMGFIAFVNAKY